MVRAVCLILFLAVMLTLAATDAGAAADRCVRLVRVPGGETLVNGCDQCKMINVQRRRPGVAVPSVRKITLPQQSSQPLPFRCPGQTRVIGVGTCQDEAPFRTGTKMTEPAKCVRFEQTATGDAMLVNSCQVCRVVGVERMDTRGKATPARYAVPARTMMPFKARGAATARIVSDDVCS